MRRTRFESIGRYTPETVRSTAELVAGLGVPGITDLELLTGVENRRVCASGPDGDESSFDLAVRAIEDCLRHSDYTAAELDIIVSGSIIRTRRRGIHCGAPPFALMLRNAIGAHRARCLDVSNACAGMITGVLVLDRMIKAGVVRNGLVVSGEQLSPAAETAVREISTRTDPQFAALTLGDAGVAVVMDDRGDDDDEIHHVELMTLAEGAELCLGMPSNRSNGIALYTDTRTMQSDAHYRQGLDRLATVAASTGQGRSGANFDFCIYHQFSEPAIDHLHEMAGQRFGAPVPTSLKVLRDYGNTGSTSHFLVLHEHLRQQRIPKGSKLLMFAQASGIVGGGLAATVSRLEA
ncbi:3-oxoacyl-ACP synthase III family protein [Nocardia tenerifensis]|uniref:3-oxoacyl-ACP synthase III family protein n=1 Tax=Nocardia tenerifensis TaxID=228006 RepID=UPI000D76A268|nr:3-oxoacyl-[acyl-carrier-protein] synthase III C-terminal domain-containing protein [Nocardia tenerifensis]